MPGLLCVSLTGATMRRPRMPPLAFTSSIAISAPSRKLVPDTAPALESSMTIGMLTVCCACAVTAPNIKAAPSQFAFTSPSSLESLVLQDVEACVRIGQIHDPVAVDVAVGRLDHLRPVGPRIHHLRRIRRHVER